MEKNEIPCINPLIKGLIKWKQKAVKQKEKEMIEEIRGGKAEGIWAWKKKGKDKIVLEYLIGSIGNTQIEISYKSAYDLSKEIMKVLKGRHNIG